MSGLLIAPVEVLLGLSYGLVLGLVLAALVGGCNVATRYATDVSVPPVAAGVAAVPVAGLIAAAAGVVEPTPTQLPRLLVGASVVFALAAYASSRGARLAADLPRATAQSTVRSRTLAADAIDSIDAMGQVTVRTAGSVRDRDGYPPLGPSLRTRLEDGAWRLPADLPLSELETRLEDRLRTSEGLAAVAVSVDARGRATITAAPPTNAVANEVPASQRAVSISALVPVGLAPGDAVRLATDSAVASGTVLHVPSDDGFAGGPRASGSLGGETGIITVATPTTETAPLLEADCASVVVESEGTTHAFDAISLLERGGESIRRVRLTAAVRDAVADDAIDVVAFAVRTTALSLEDVEDGRRGWTFEPAVDALEIGSEAVLVGTEADEFGPNPRPDPCSNATTGTAPEVDS